MQVVTKTVIPEWLKIPMLATTVFFVLSILLTFIQFGKINETFLQIFKSPVSYFYLFQILVLLYIINLIANKKDKSPINKYRSTGNYIKEIIFVLITSFSILRISNYLITKINPPTKGNLLFQHSEKANYLILLFCLLSYVIFFIYRTLQLQQDQLLEKTNLKLKLSNIQYEYYKNNLNPRFLSKSLHTLQSILKADKNKAEIFLVKLSKTYRYLLENQNKEKIAVRDELEFVFQYVFLVNQIENSNIEIKLKNEIPNNKYVLPHTIGLLIEHVSENLKYQELERIILYLNFNENYFSIILGNTDSDQTIQNQEQLIEKYSTYNIPILITIEKTKEKALKFEYV